MTSLEPLERVVSTLARDPNLPRVKKLLYCACYGVWEDNAERLNQVSLQEIVQGVWERSPTLEALQFQLNRVVKTLNKPVAYAHVANGVLAVLNDLYFDTYDITQPVMVNRVQFPLAMPSAPGSPSNAGNPAAVANPGLNNLDFNGPVLEPAHYGDAHATPQGHFEAQPGSNGGVSGQQAYGSSYGANQGYQNHDANPGVGHPQAAPAAYGAGPHGRQSPQAFPQAAPAGSRPASYSQTNHPQAGHAQGSHHPQAGYAQEAAAPSEPPATQWFVGGQQGSSASTLTPAQLSAQTAVRAHVLQSLSQHREQRRMKKLLVCVCHNQWENNRAQLDVLDWELLLDDARRLMPTIQGLEHVLKAIVNSLSKPMEYLQVAEVLLEMVTPLYEQERPDETQFFGVTPEPSARDIEQSQTYVREQGPGSARRAAPSQAGPTYPAPGASNFRAPAPAPSPTGIARAGLYGAQPARRTSDSLVHSSGNASGHALGNGGLPEENDGPPTGLFAPQLPASPMDSKYPPRALPGGGYAGDAMEESTAAIAQVVGDDAIAHPVVGHPMADQAGANVYKNAQDWGDGAAAPLRSDDAGMTPEEEAESDEFTLRLNLMRYANPLMSKVVIFSALHRLFRFSEQDWIELRHHSLASLMEELEQRYPNLIDLEMKLCGVAEQLEVPEQAMQTVAALMKVLKPRYDNRYDHGKQAPARDMGLAIANRTADAQPVGVDPFNRPEKATAIQFGPEGGAMAQQTPLVDPDDIPGIQAQPVEAEILPSDDVSSEALMSDDLEADLAMLAASLEDDGPSLPNDS